MARDRDLVRIEVDDPRITCGDFARALQPKTGLKNVVVVAGSQASTACARRAVTGTDAISLVERLPNGDALGLGSDKHGSDEFYGHGKPAPDRRGAVGG